MHRLPLAVVMVACACAKPEAPTSVAPAEPSTSPSAPLRVDPAPTDNEALADIEDNLLAADFAIRFDIEATGAVHARFVGELRSRGDTITLAANGSFGGEAVELSLRGDGEHLLGSNGVGTLDLPQPGALKEALVIGLTRMGILHNLAVLVAVRPPDHSDGGVASWVRADATQPGVRVGPGIPTNTSSAAHTDAISFGIMVAGNPAGEATLWWDRSSRLPIERHQIVRFPDGEMRVRESYRAETLVAVD